MSVLINLSKIFESLLYNHLQSVCHAPNFLAKKQFGYRKHRNTFLVALSLIDKVLPAFEDKKYERYVFLDYSANFDTLSRLILCDQLERFGILGVNYDFIMS